MLHTHRALANRQSGSPPGLGGYSSVGFVHLPKPVRHLAHDVGQRSHNPCADPKISSWRPLEPSRSHQEAEHKANCDNRQCDDNEGGEKHVEHVVQIFTTETQSAQRRQSFKVLFTLCVLCVSVVNFSVLLVECRWNCRIQRGTKTKLDLLFSYP
jgi:hypothetical protein